jgi:hypothetical protein
MDRAELKGGRIIGLSRYGCQEEYLYLCCVSVYEGSAVPEASFSGN